MLSCFQIQSCCLQMLTICRPPSICASEPSVVWCFQNEVGTGGSPQPLDESFAASYFFCSGSICLVTSLTFILGLAGSAVCFLMVSAFRVCFRWAFPTPLLSWPAFHVTLVQLEFTWHVR